MRSRDPKGRFTKALAKTRPQIPTEVKLERKLARIEQSEHKLKAARAALLLSALFIALCSVFMAAGPVIGSMPISVVGGLGFFWRVNDLAAAHQRYWKYRATHQRLLKGADGLTNKLLAEEGLVIEDRHRGS